MRVNRYKKEEWDRHVQQFGFKRGYSVMAIRLLFMEVHNDKLIESHRRRKAQMREYDRKRYIQKREQYREYNRKRWRANLEENRAKRRQYYQDHIRLERARHREYYYNNKLKWDLYRSRAAEKLRRKGEKE